MLRRLIGLTAFFFSFAVHALAQGPFAYIGNHWVPPYWYGGFVSVVDTSTNTLVTQIPTDGAPASAVVDPSGARVYVAHLYPYGGRIDVISTATNTVVASVTVGTAYSYQINGVAISPDGRRLYATAYGTKEVYVVDTATYTQVNAIAVGDMPHGVAFNPAGTRAYVANWGDGSLSVIDTSTETVVKTIPLMLDPPRPFGTNGGSHGVAVNWAGTRVYVTNFNDDSVSVIDATTDTVLDLVHVGEAPTGLALNSDGTRAYVANRYSDSLSVIDTSTNTVVATIAGMEREPTGVGVSPSGGKLYVTAYRSGKAVVIDLATGTIVDRVDQGVGSYNPYGLFIGPPVGPNPMQPRWGASYGMFWDTHTDGDAVVDANYQFSHWWSFNLYNRSGALLPDPRITATLDGSLAGVTAVMNQPGVTVTQPPPSFVWSMEQLAPQGLEGGSVVGSLSTTQSIPDPYALGYDVTRAMSDEAGIPVGREIPAGAVGLDRTFTLTFTAHDTSLADIAASIDFSGQGPDPRPVTASDVSCSGSGWLMMTPGMPVFWKIGESGYDSLQHELPYTLTCTLTLTNNSTSPALFSPSIVVSGRRLATPVTGIGSVSYTLGGEASDPADRLGATVTFETGASDAEASLDVVFTRSVIFSGANAVVLAPPTLTASPITTTDGNVTVSGTGMPYARVSLFDGQTPLPAVIWVDANGNWSIGRYFLVGSHPLSATQTSGGQTSGPSPSVTVYRPPPPPNITGPTSVTSATSPATVTLSGFGFYGAGPTGSTVTIFEGPAPLATAVVTSDGRWSAPITLPYGPHSLTASQTLAGLTSPLSPPFVVTVKDDAPPVLTLPQNMVVEATGPGGAHVTFMASANDATSGPAPVTCSPASGSLFPLGSTTVSCGASDVFGNTATGTFTVTVRDTTPPVLRLPQNMVAEATGPGGARVTFMASANDATSGPALVSCVPASGSLFPAGSTTVRCEASDASGNTTSGSFTVTVRDTTPPVIETVTASPGVLWPANHKLVSIALGVTVSDAVTPAPVCRVVSVNSNEPMNGPGDGNTAADYVFSGVGLDLSLRAERAGNLTGRIYTVGVVCKDTAGNNSTAKTVAIEVPHDKGKK